MACPASRTHRRGTSSASATTQFGRFVGHFVQRAVTNAMGPVSAIDVQGHALSALFLASALPKIAQNGKRSGCKLLTENGGERRMRTLEGCLKPASCRSCVAESAINTMCAVAHCTLLHAGVRRSFEARPTVRQVTAAVRWLRSRRLWLRGFQH